MVTGKEVSEVARFHKEEEPEENFFKYEDGSDHRVIYIRRPNGKVIWKKESRFPEYTGKDGD